MSANTESTLPADKALLRLKAGNDRFVLGTARFPTRLEEISADLAKGQHPYATILSWQRFARAARADLRRRLR